MRRRLLTTTPARLALALGALTLAATGLHSTTAAFTDEASSSFTVTTGSVVLERDGDGLVFSSAPLAPGDDATATVRLKNDGTLRATLALAHESVSSTQPGGCAVRDALTLRVVEDLDGVPATTGDRREIADGPLASAATAELGTFEVDEERSYELTLTFVAQGAATGADNDNCSMGSVATERLEWTAVEASS